MSWKWENDGIDDWDVASPVAKPKPPAAARPQPPCQPAAARPGVPACGGGSGGWGDDVDWGGGWDAAPKPQTRSAAPVEAAVGSLGARAPPPPSSSRPGMAATLKPPPSRPPAAALAAAAAAAPAPDPHGIEALPGESEAHYAARQARLQEEAAARMRVK